MGGPPTGPDVAMAKTQMGAHAMMHGYSVGQKAKKKDPKPEEKRPGDWQCECGNYNFSWRKKCNACEKAKPFNPIEEKAKQLELEKIKADRAKRMAAKAKAEQPDLKDTLDRERRDRERGRGRDDHGGRADDRGGRDERGGRDDRGGRGDDRGGRDDRTGRGDAKRGRDEGNANMIPLGRQGSKERERSKSKRS